MSQRRILLASILVRFALAASFLSAVADRFGIWGAAGSGQVAWGNFEAFINYTGTLLPFLPRAGVVVCAYVATGTEVLLAIALVFGVQLRIAAIASGILLLMFALSMTFFTGPEGPLSYSVWTAAAAAFLLTTLEDKKDDTSSPE
jgi:uncharacterized membrane protein YphA (DoxX/SURF4 family)